MISTADMFLAAFSMSRGGELVAVEVRGGEGRRMAVFHADETCNHMPAGAAGTRGDEEER